MTKEEIINYIKNTPENTNLNVLADMLNELGEGNIDNDKLLTFPMAEVTFNLTTTDGSEIAAVGIQTEMGSDWEGDWVPTSVSEYIVFTSLPNTILIPIGLKIHISVVDTEEHVLSFSELAVTGEAAISHGDITISGNCTVTGTVYYNDGK